MATAFVWFSLGAEDPTGAREFYRSLLGWDIGDDGTVVAGDRPWAAINNNDAGRRGWLPYVQVDDVDRATERAQELGATLLQGKTQGPAGEYSTIADPAGAAIALWQPA